jgi:hypothetical protein
MVQIGIFCHNPKRKRGPKTLPHLRFSMLRCFRRPKGAATYQPGATPRVWEEKRVPSPEKAVQTADAAKLSCPFRTTASLCFVNPGRCPGLICFRPFRAEKPRALHFTGQEIATSIRFGLCCFRHRFLCLPGCTTTVATLALTPGAESRQLLAVFWNPLRTPPGSRYAFFAIWTVIHSARDATRRCDSHYAAAVLKCPVRSGFLSSISQRQPDT